MKPTFVFAALALGLAPLAAVAQTASSPTASGQTPAAAPPSGPAAAFQVPGPAEEQKAESALTTTIAAFQSGKPNYDDMEGGIIDAVKAQSGALTAGLSGLGKLRSLDYVGYSPKGVWRYSGDFANGKAELMIGFGPNGKIQTLWFKPVAA